MDSQAKLLRYAFHQSKKIVIPLAVGVSLHILSVPPIHDGDIRSIAIYASVECVCLVLNRFDNLTSRPLPAVASKVRYALELAGSITLVDTFHLNVGHLVLFCRSSEFRRSRNFARG